MKIVINVLKRTTTGFSSERDVLSSSTNLVWMSGVDKLDVCISNIRLLAFINLPQISSIM